ncbi:MAG: TetR/AcrR family transcriptional regulator [Kiritimatiellae bacterium]|jgi:AcrR family transcriptional regulator|nr:TetR/AcrR family transcriptional regulator [Kiritimatiellia bacterium]
MNERKISGRRRGRPAAAVDGELRERLLDAATALFAEKGIAAVSMAGIAAHVGVTSAMLHYYFKTRERLLDVVVEERFGRFIAAVSEGIDQGAGDPLTMVHDLVTRIIRLAGELPWLPALWIKEIASDGGQLRERLIKRLPDGTQRRFGECVAKAQKRGIVNPDLQPYLLFVSIIGLSLFPLAVAKIWKRFPTLGQLGNEDVISHATSLLTYGLAGHGAKKKAKKGF